MSRLQFDQYRNTLFECYGGVLREGKLPHSADVLESLQREISTKLDTEESVRRVIAKYHQTRTAANFSSMSGAEKAASFNEILKLYGYIEEEAA